MTANTLRGTDQHHVEWILKIFTCGDT